MGLAVRTSAVDILQSEIRRIQGERDQIKLDYSLSRAQNIAASRSSSESVPSVAKGVTAADEIKSTPSLSPPQTIASLKSATVWAGHTAVFEGGLFVSVQGISFEGSPLAHKANLKVAVDGGEEKTITKMLPGDKVEISGPTGIYEVRVLTTDTSTVEVQVSVPVVP